MRNLSLAGVLVAAATIIAAPVAAQAPTSPQRELSVLLRQDAGLRERIGRIQLDALVARVDQTIGHPAHPGDQSARPVALRRALDLYTF